MTAEAMKTEIRKDAYIYEEGVTVEEGVKDRVYDPGWKPAKEV